MNKTINFSPTKIPFFKLGLLLIGLFFGTLQSHAQVSSDGNVQYEAASATTITMTGFSVPAGNNAVLVVYSIGEVASTNNLTFAGNPLTKLAESPTILRMSIWYLALGDLAAPLSGNIVATYSVPNSNAFYAISYKNVDQVTPMENFGVSDFGLANASFLSVNSDSTNDLIVDLITARNDGPSPTVAVGPGQSKLGEQTNQLQNGSLNSTHALSQEVSGGSAVSMIWTTNAHTSNRSHHIAANINGDLTVASPAGIPTLSEWGLLILALLLMTLGTLYLLQPRTRFEQER